MNDLPDDIKKQLHHMGGTEESVMGKLTPPLMPEVIYACADSFESHGEVLTQQTQDPDYATS